MAKQEFLVTYEKKIVVDTDSISGWEHMESWERDEVISEIAFGVLNLEGPDTEDVVGVG